MSLDLRTIARALGGEVQGRQVLAPGPNHSRSDRSLSVRISHQSPTGYIVFSHAGDDFRDARDYVAAKLGLGPDTWRRRQGETLYNVQGSAQRQRTDIVDIINDVQPDDTARIARAAALWDEARPAAGTVVEPYLASRGLSLNLVDTVNEVIRYHARAPWKDDTTGEVIRVPAMVCAMRSIIGDSLTAVHVTRLTPEGAKVGRRIRGVASGSAVKLSDDASVEQGLTIGEGIETTLTGMLYGLRPAWAVGSADAIAKFPLLSGLDGLTILGEAGPANARAVETCGQRWVEAGREVIVIDPVRGSDINDAMREAV